MFLEVEQNPNFEGSYFIRFKEVGPPREISHVKSYDRLPHGEWCEVTGWCDNLEQPLCPAFAQKVEDSGAGTAFIIFGGNWGIRFKPDGHKGAWNLYDSKQWGEGYLSIGEERDLRFVPGEGGV
ncbi:MAG: hypothetical protein V3T42_13675 [Nitrospirales bacterium]